MSPFPLPRQPTRCYWKMFLRSSSGWLHRVFYVGTENQEEQLKSHPIYDLEDLKDLWSKMTIFLETFTADGYLGRNLMVCPSETKNGSWRLFLDGETSHLWLEVIDICLVHCSGSGYEDVCGNHTTHSRRLMQYFNLKSLGSHKMN